MKTGTTTDRIEKIITLRAPRSRVWRALTVAEQFGEWFRAKLEGRFVEGGTVRGRITHPGYEHLAMEIVVERIDPERYFAAFRMNDNGWSEQLKNIERHVSQP